MNESPLKLSLIEAPLVIKHFVKGDALCNYELYITEVINASKHFSRYGLFCSPTSESNGECDAYAGDYGLDYKLIASKTALQAKSIHSLQTEILADGVYSLVGCKHSGSMTVTRLTQALRGQSVDALLAIRNRTGKKQGIENDIKEYMLTIETPKNLLLFFPYKFSFVESGELEDDCKTIVSAINEDYQVSLLYRTSLHPLLDTYALFLFDYYFVLCQWDGQQLEYLECIPIEKSKTFMHLALTYCEDWHEKYDVILRELRQQNEQH